MIGLDYNIKKRYYIRVVAKGRGAKKALCCIGQYYVTIDILWYNFYLSN